MYPNLKSRIVLCFTLMLQVLQGYTQDDTLDLPMETASIVAELEQNISIDYEALREDFLTREEPVLNLSNPDPLDLLAIPGISPGQAEIIHQYILKYGPLLSVWELYLLPGVDTASIRKAIPYLTFEPVRGSGIKRMRNQMSLAADAEGKKRLKLSGKAGGFLDLALSFREAKEAVSGLEQETVADRIHGSVRYTGAQGEQLILGDYRASYGQGLTFAPGSGIFSQPEDWRKRSAGIRPYSGYSGFGSLRGLAGGFKAGQVNTQALLSTLPDQQVYGVHLNYGRNLWKAGITLIHARSVPDSSSASDLYTIYYNRSGILQMAGLDAVAIFGKTAVYGEICLPMGRIPAVLGGFRYDPIPRLGLQLMIRHLPPDFSNPFSSVNTVDGNPGNELSVSFQIRAAVAAWLNLTSGIDFARHPWYRYRSDHTSRSSVYNLNARIMISRKAAISLNWRRKINYTNTAELSFLHPLGNQEKQSFRINLNQQISARLEFCSRGVVVFDRKAGETAEGYLLSQEVTAEAFKDFRIKLRYGLYETDGYQQSIYLFTQNVPEIYSMQPFYGRGQGLDLLVSWKLFRKLKFFLQGNFRSDSKAGMQFAFQFSP